MDSNRRNFLIQTASAAGVIGLGYLLWERPCSETCPPPPALPADTGKPPRGNPPGELLQAALRRMAAENKPGVAVRIPVDPKQRCIPGHVLVEFLNERRLDVAELFAESVVVCLEDAAIHEQIAGADPSHQLVLFGTDRRATAGVAMTWNTAWDRFVPGLTELLHGADGRRLRARADSIRRKTEEAVVAALGRMADDQDGNVVLEKASTIAPLLVYERLQPTPEKRKKLLADILKTYIDESNPKLPGPRLPFGVEAATEVGCCGDSCRERPPRDVMVKCGMGRVSPEARTFLRYLKA